MRPGTPPGAAGALVLAAIVCGASPLSVASAGDEPPAGLTRGDWSQIRRQVAAASYHASPAPGQVPGPAVQAVNARQRYNATFRRGGIELASAGGVTVPWRVDLSVTGYGYAGDLRRLDDADPQADKERVEYRRGALTEWYVNRPGGLEQGFELQEPRPRRQGPLVVALAVGGDMDVAARDGGAAFVDRSGETLVRYAGLTAWDAEGRPLVARLEVAGREIRLSVDAENARFPVTLDPTFVHQAQLFGRGDVSELAGTGFGSAVAVDGDTAAVGAFQQAGVVGPAVGAAYVFLRTGGVWGLQQKLLAADGSVGDQFGASIAISGETVVVGAPFEDNDVTIVNDEGAAYVFVRSGGVWAEQQKLVASDAATGDQLGWRVSISGDTFVAGAPGDDVGGQTDIGSAYVFVRSGTAWTEQQKLAATGGAVLDALGSGVSVSGDTAVVGARLGDGAAVDSGSAYVFVRAGTTWAQQQELTASDGATGDAFGDAVSVSFETVVAGAPGDGGSQGSAYVFVRSGATWTEQQKLLASDGATNDAMGSSVSISGDTVVAGAPNKSTFTGAAYVFVRSGATWSEQQKLLSGGAGILFFGTSVSVSGDTAMVGEHAGGTGVGSAYAFVRSGTTWSMQAFLQPPYVTASDQFGHAAAVSGDTVVVGAPLDDRPAGADQGSAYVFVWTGTYWAEQQLLQPSDGAAGDNFGFAVSVDGDTLVVGAIWDDTAAGTDTGSAYVFVRSGATWTEQQKLTASDAATIDGFGSSVSISGDTVVIGAINDDVAGQDTGSAYVFVRSGTTWTEQQKLTAPDAAPFDWFGSSAAIAGDTAVLGAPTADTVGADAGSAYVFVRAGTTWSLQQKLGASDAAAGDGFGTGVSLSGDTAVIGAPFLFSAPAPPGGAYVFVRSGTAWSEQQKLVASDAVSGDKFGQAVAVSGDTVAVGSLLGDTPGGPNTGAAYVFVRAGTTWTEQPPKLVAPDGSPGDAFGYAVALSGDVAVVGALLDDTVGGAESGSAHVFRRISIADLGVTKTDGQTTASPGEQIVYTITVSNAGPEAVTGATVTDVVPAALTGATWTCSASAGSSCTPSGAGSINDTVDLLVGGTATYLLTGTVDAAATGTLSNTATVAPGTGDFDPDTANNSATDIDTLAPEADLSVTKTDSPDPVLPGGTLTYVATVTNLGPSAATSVTLVDTLPAGVTFVSSTPGPPICNIAGPTLTCGLGTLASGGSATVTIVTTVNAGTGILLNAASVSAAEPDPSSANNSASADTAVGQKDGELAHGSVFVFDLAAQPGPVADEDVFRISQKPYSSYEVVVDATSGDIGAGSGPLLERIGPDGSTVVQASVPVGAGPSRSLRWTNTTASEVDGETVRVRSATCGTDCGPDDVYRIRSYETTDSVPRFNNSGTQVTVLILQNPTNEPITGEVYFREPTGTLVATHPLSLGPKETLVVNTASIPGAGGVSGAITVAHDGRYGDLSGKTVALEPATGFSFDSALERRP